ncbi:MAG: outer membrane lipoprotein carrier protein LolA [Spirochaetia bacterium]|nr:outer membrane lipoprotein carrier protein LolA [Spirochaetia bacterium]
MKNALTLIKKLILTRVLAFVFLLAQFISPVSGVYNEKNFEQVIGQLSKIKKIASDFKQIKKIKALKSPLISKGSFLFHKKENKISWNLKSPFEVSFVITDQEITQKEKGKEPIRITPKNQPLIFEFTQVLFSIFSGNRENLNNYFNIDFNGGLKNWNLTLTPKNENIQKIIKKLALSGDSSIRELKIFDQGEDITTITFINTKTN